MSLKSEALKLTMAFGGLASTGALAGQPPCETDFNISIAGGVISAAISMSDGQGYLRQTRMDPSTLDEVFIDDISLNQFTSKLQEMMTALESKGISLEAFTHGDADVFISDHMGGSTSPEQLASLYASIAIEMFNFGGEESLRGFLEFSEIANDILEIGETISSLHVVMNDAIELDMSRAIVAQTGPYSFTCGQ